MTKELILLVTDTHDRSGSIMTGIDYLLSMAVMGFVLLAVAGTAVRGVDWRQYKPETRPGTGDERGDALSRYGSVLGAVARNPGTWYVAFVVLVFGFVAGALAMVTSPPELGGAVGVALILASAVVLCSFLFWGIYASGRYRGLASAQAAMAGAWALGALLIVAIVVKLVVSGP